MKRVFRAIGVESSVIQCFRSGRSDNPRSGKPLVSFGLVGNPFSFEIKYV